MLPNVLINNIAFGPLSKPFSVRKFMPAEDVEGLFLSKRLAKYTLLEKLGEGAFGTVWLAETTLPNGDRVRVAIKTTQRAWIDGPEYHIHEELDFLNFFTKTAPGSRYTTQLIESFVDEYNYYIVQEYVPGGTLRDEIWRYGKLDQTRAVYILVQLITIIRHMHRHGVMHRDIKPENILLDAAGNVILADFGMAYRFQLIKETDMGLVLSPDILETTEYCGTLGYMSPQVLLEHEYSSPADIYSLGVLFYEMLTGELPFHQRRSADAALAMLYYDFYLPVDSFGPEVADLLYSMMEWDECRRIKIEDFQAHSLFHGIDWDTAERRLYDSNYNWAPPIATINQDRTIDKNVLLHGQGRRATWFRVGVTPFDQAFNTPFQPLEVNRSSPPPPGRALFQLCKPFRASVRNRQPTRIPHISKKHSPEGPARAAHQPLSLKRVDTSTVIDQENPLERELEEGEIVEETRAPASLVPSAVRTSAIVIPKTRISRRHDAATKYSCFAVSIGQVDELLLSPCSGMGPRRAFAFRAHPLSPSPPTPVFMPTHVTTSKLLTAPSIPALDSTGTSLASSSGPITPASENPNAAIWKDEPV
ncbi:Serine/threonine-protein kinase MARK2 [Sanghuangporus baumii]|uniref:Serine/threonine-protein kinase MARK2 n=1 Tax=Sanghuangporus baumii TaxID=108892 RepID=A0A9Q5HX25_SANBA|nr:Serine/threonine-protein kinase MARK2 [Sanghuangporus baumii]